MENLLIAVIAGLLVLLASVASVELGVSVALIEISLGVVAGNFLGLTSPPWMDFLASFGSILLTFLAGAEVDPRVMRQKFKESLLIGGLFDLPRGRGGRSAGDAAEVQREPADRRPLLRGPVCGRLALLHPGAEEPGGTDRRCRQGDAGDLCRRRRPVDDVARGR